jgi:hypothetical protein
VPPVAPPNVKETHVLSHDSADDTLGLELDQVYARLAGDEHGPDVLPKPDEDESRGP